MISPQRGTYTVCFTAAVIGRPSCEPTPSSRRRARHGGNAFCACLGSVDRLIVWAPAIAERYHECLGVPLEKMVPLHYHHSLTGYQLPAASKRNYLFSGGDSMRDYPTLIEAVRGLSIPVRIATRSASARRLACAGPCCPRSNFRGRVPRPAGGARLAVFPLRTDTLRTSGQQSYLNAMALAKPVIVTDPRDAPYYIEDGKTGRLVPARPGSLAPGDQSGARRSCSRTGNGRAGSGVCPADGPGIHLEPSPGHRRANPPPTPGRQLVTR